MLALVDLLRQTTAQPEAVKTLEEILEIERLMPWRTRDTSHRGDRCGCL